MSNWVSECSNYTTQLRNSCKSKIVVKSEMANVTTSKHQQFLSAEFRHGFRILFQKILLISKKQRIGTTMTSSCHKIVNGGPVLFFKSWTMFHYTAQTGLDLTIVHYLRLSAEISGTHKPGIHSFSMSWKKILTNTQRCNSKNVNKIPHRKIHVYIRQ